VAVAPNIVWLLAEPATIVIMHLSLQKELGRAKVPMERPNCVAVGDGVVACWSIPAGSSGFELNEGSMLHILRASDCCIIVQTYLHIPSVRSCCIASGFIWAVTTSGIVVVISFTGTVLQEFDFRLQYGAGALSVCACPLAHPYLSMSDDHQCGVVVSSYAGLFAISRHELC
jgi:hypothetical protein